MSLIHYFVTVLFLGWSPLSYGSAESISLLGGRDQVVVYLQSSSCFLLFLLVLLPRKAHSIFVSLGYSNKRQTCFLTKLL